LQEKKLYMPLDHPKVLVEAILQQTPVAFLLVNKDGQVIFVNEAALQLAWKNPEHTIDAQSAPEVWGDTQDFEGRAIPVEEWPIAQALHGIKTVGKELRMIRPDGSHYDISISAAPLRTEDGIIGAIASFIEITERRLAEQKLTAISARLEELGTERARGSIHLMHLIGLSANNVTDIREMFQIALTEICSHLHWPVGYAYIVKAPGRLHGISAWYSYDAGRYEALRRATTTIDFSLKQSVIGQVLKSGTTIFLPDLDSEEHFLRKDAVRKAGLKSYLAIPVIVHKQPAAILEFFHLEPIEPQDSVLEVMEVIAAHLGQVIEQKRAEKKLQALFDSAPDAQIVTDMLGTIVMANRQTTKLFGYSQEELLGHAVEMLLPADLRTQHIQHRARYVAAPHPRPMGIGMELRGLCKDQTEVPVEVSLSPIELEEGSLIAGAMRDVRERKELEEKLRAKERLADMGMTAAIFVHELANPLNGISTTAQFIKEMISTDGQDLIANLIIETDRLKLLLDQFRSLSRLSDLKLNSIEFRTLADHVVKINSRYWLERDIRTVTDFSGDLTLSGDAAKLQQAIFNLTGNAAESMPDGGTLTLRAYGTHEEVIFEVTDTGPGIPEGIDVFALFTTTKAQGTGLGMHIVQQIVLAHLGTITYSSEHGKGTTFRVTLPRKRNPKA
jgi:PAS domain S-box-containing protein